MAIYLMNDYNSQSRVCSTDQDLYLAICEAVSMIIRNHDEPISLKAYNYLTIFDTETHVVKKVTLSIFS